MYLPAKKLVLGGCFNLYYSVCLCGSTVPPGTLQVTWQGAQWGSACAVTCRSTISGIPLSNWGSAWWDSELKDSKRCSQQLSVCDLKGEMLLHIYVQMVSVREWFMEELRIETVSAEVWLKVLSARLFFLPIGPLDYDGLSWVLQIFRVSNSTDTVSSPQGLLSEGHWIQNDL